MANGLRTTPSRPSATSATCPPCVIEWARGFATPSCKRLPVRPWLTDEYDANPMATTSTTAWVANLENRSVTTPLVELRNVSREFDGGQASNTPEVASMANTCSPHFATPSPAVNGPLTGVPPRVSSVGARGRFRPVHRAIHLGEGGEMRSRAARIAFAAAVVLVLGVAPTGGALAFSRIVAGPQGDGTGVTPNGWVLTPAGRQLDLADQV